MNNVAAKTATRASAKAFNFAKASATGALLCSLLALAACGGEASGGVTSSASSSSSSSSASSSSNSSSGLVDNSGGAAYQAANGLTGGRLYERFWAAETGFSLDNSKLSDTSQLDKIEAQADFYGCVNCHGWDRLGRQGGHSNRAPTPSRPRVADVDLVKLSDTTSPQTLFNRIKSGGNYRDFDEDLENYHPDNNSSVGDRMPKYSQILTDAQIWDIVKFLKEEALDTTRLYDLVLLDGQYPRARGFLNMGVEGSALAGDLIYAENCASCHGEKGTAIRLEGEFYTVGSFVRTKPHESQHLVKFGHLNGAIGAALTDITPSQMQDLFAALRDEAQYPSTATVPEPEPTPEPGPEPIDGEFAFLRHCSGCHSGGGEGPLRPRYGDVTGASAALINAMIQIEPNMHHLKPDDPAQAVPLEVVDAIAEFLIQ